MLLVRVAICRGSLGSILARVRTLADQEYANAATHGKRLYRSLRKNESTPCCSSCDPSSAPAHTDTAEALPVLCGVCAMDDLFPEEDTPKATQQKQPSRSGNTGSQIVMRNFRELLWYWQEYYLRRGRDRLSIEFSCHIPFSYWFEIVGKCHSML
jgi:hypothetical protein